MARSSLLERLLRGGFREQKTRLRIDWLTHTDELIMEQLEAADSPLEPPEIATTIERSTEYVADRCRQLEIRGLLDTAAPTASGTIRYELASRGRQYLADELDPDELMDDVHS